MPKPCDHTSVGMLVWKDVELLLIERKRPPFGFAPPAGHVDEDSDFESAARRELTEEVGLNTQTLTLAIEGKKENPCRREDGSWHYWKIYTTIAEGEVQPSKEETKQARWFSTPDLLKLSLRTDEYLQGKITEEAWQQQPGLEPVWYEWFQELKII